MSKSPQAASEALPSKTRFLCARLKGDCAPQSQAGGGIERECAADCRGRPVRCSSTFHCAILPRRKSSIVRIFLPTPHAACCREWELEKRRNSILIARPNFGMLLNRKS